MPPPPTGKTTKKATSSEAKKEQKKQLKQQAAAAALERQRLIKAANQEIDLLAPLPAFSTYTRNGTALTITAAHAEALPAGVIDWAVELCATNMADIYEADGWSWSRKSKRQELADPAMRYLLAWDSATHTSNATTNNPLAYLAFRFDEEDNVPVVYVYEVQLTGPVRRKGVGRFLMQVVELLGCRCGHGMEKTMLTVQQSNTAAHALYQSMRYHTDDSSPDDTNYTILSKTLPKPRQQ